MTSCGKVAFVLPPEHELGDRVTELARKHAEQPIVRFFTTVDGARLWLNSQT